MTKLQRGPKRKLMISVIINEDSRHLSDSKDVTLSTDTITVDDKALVLFKFWWSASKSNLLPCVAIKKKETTDDRAVQITITSENFKVQTWCPDEWMELHMNRKEANSKAQCIRCKKMTLFTLEVNITVNDVIPMSARSNELYEDTEFTDFQLHATDGTVPVHKAILTIHSDMFKTMLRGEWKETAEARINMDGVTQKTLQHLKDYMYLGTLPDEGLKELLLFAECYLMEKLKAACITKLIQSVKPEDFEDIVKFACQSNIAEELVTALIMQIPDDVVNGLHQLKLKK